MYYPSIYEINTRVWLRKFADGDKHATLADVPFEYWKNLAALGFDYVWLMGVWEICPNSIPKYCMGENSKREYKAALTDWREEDVIGSPFAINNYEVNSAIGRREDILVLKEQLNKLQMKLVLDFIPNHFSAESKLLESNPEIFLQVSKEKYEEDKETFFKDPFGREIYFAHGRDPYFPSWSDTVQVNYFSNETREFMLNALLKVREICDGVRCDMAMLMLNDIFYKTWGGVLPRMNRSNHETEFWESAIQKVKFSNPGFIFIAEAYWDLERRLQQLGFDFTYDKKLTDLLVNGNAESIRGHLNAEIDYQNKSVRFIENHDEERGAASLGIQKSKAASVISSSLPGMRFYHDGQFEGKKIRLPVQLAREPLEPVNAGLVAHYKNLLNITGKNILKTGNWELIPPLPAGSGDYTFNDFVVWQWSLDNKRMLFVVNYSNKTSYCRIKLHLEGNAGEVLFNDVLNKKEYREAKAELHGEGLFIKLDAFESHIFSYTSNGATKS